jgi:truncated hemoglobin YjbI
MAGFSEQERQMYEYNILKEDFDAIVSRFMEKITVERQGRPISQHDMEKEWGKYLAKVA